MPEIQISVTGKIAKVRDAPVIVCGNSDYTVQFTFDSEWDDYEEKTAEFRYWRSGERKKDEVLFSGDTVSVPILRDINDVEVGVYAGNLHTSTPAKIDCIRSITDGDAVHDPPSPDVYNQLMEYLAGIQSGGAQVGNAVPALYGTAYSVVGIAEETEESYGFNDMRFGDADTLARAKNTSVDVLKNAGVLSAEKGIVHLIPREELPEAVNPNEKIIWKLTQQLTQAFEVGGFAKCANILAGCT